MRIALVLASNLYVSPYVRYYTEIMDQVGVSYDIISWNRLGAVEAGVHAFDLKSSLRKSVFLKAIDYFRYCRFVKSKLRQGNYDKVVVFTIVQAVMLFPFLKARYRNNYVFDIRDYSVAARYCKGRFTKVIRNAAMTVISSSGYKAWLPPEGRYVIGHNTSASEPLEMKARIEGQATHKILTIGALAYYDANRAMIEQLADSPMFHLEFAGSGHAEQGLKDLVARSKIQNVTFKGRYAKQDEPKLLEGAALISILIDDSLNSTTCMSNRFYLSLVHGIPMMVDENTEQAAWVRKYDLGVVIDRRAGIKDQIMRYLQTFDRQRYDAGRRASLLVVQQEMRQFNARLREFVLQ